MSQTRTFYAASSARRSISRRAYILFSAGAGMLICAALSFGIALANDPPRVTFQVIAGVAACAGGVGLIFGVVTLARLQQPIRVEVSDFRLVWREGKRIAIINYEDVLRVELVKATEVRRDGVEVMFPVIRFIERSGEMMEFEVTFEDRGMVHQSRFDGFAIAAAVLPNLSGQAIISPSLEEFLQTGEVDIDLLPDR